jgi:hypothetical protein
MAINQSNVATLFTASQGAAVAPVSKAYVGHYAQTSYLDRVKLLSGNYVVNIQILGTEVNSNVDVRLDNPEGQTIANYRLVNTGVTSTNFTVMTDYLSLNTGPDKFAPSNPTLAWTTRTSTFGTSAIQALTYGDDQNVAGTMLMLAAGDQTQVRTSTDGVTWTTRATGLTTPAATLRAATYGFNGTNGTYLVAGDSGQIAGSTDGLLWTTRAAPFGTTNINGLGYNARTFVAVGSNGTIWTSGDTTGWTGRTSNVSTNNLRAVTHGLGFRWVAVGDNGVLTTSDDAAVTWTARTSGFTNSDILTVCYGRDTTYVAAGTQGRLATSFTGIDQWIQRTTGFGNETITSVTYGDDVYVAVGAAGTVASSTDGITWVRQVAFGTTTMRAVMYVPAGATSGSPAGGRYVAAGDAGTLATGALATTETTSACKLFVTFADPNFIGRDGVGGGVTWATGGYGDGLFFIGGSGSTYSVSTNGVTWTARTTSLGGDSRGAAFGNNVYLVAGTAGTLRTSSDSVSWTARTSTFGTTNINSAVYGNGLFVIAGDSGQIRTSGDGVTWTTRDSALGVNNINALLYANSQNLFVAAGNAGTISTSTNGILWTSRTSGYDVTVNLRGLTYGNGLYMVAGTNGNLAVSTNAITWSTRNANFGLTTINALTFHRNLFMAVGDAGQLRTSTDTISWTSRNSATGANLLGATSALGTYLALGTGGAVMSKQQGTALVQFAPLVNA